MAQPQKIALITGAGSGIGLACTRMLADDGYGLVLVGRRSEPLRAAAQELSGRVPCLVHAADVGKADQASVCVDAGIAKFGRLDVIINNAGYAPVIPLDRITQEGVEEAFAVNAIGPTIIIGRAWPGMVRRGGGCIVNISSYATVDPFPGLGVYAAAKSALNMLAKACHNEGSAAGIRAFAVAPGAVETQMLRRIVPEEALPRPRTLAPEQVAQVVMECIRGARDAQSGHTILVPSP
ncbi:MAG: SDR family oxidoreductase [Phycisphaerales bacterium]|nr:SDR family oxidoreductase [Phycisphaerales bacterium]